MLRNISVKAECISLFHIITEGTCWLKTEKSEPFLLEKGNVIIFPHGCCHTMDIHPVPVMQLLDFEKIKGFPVLEYGGSGDKTQFICGYLLCDQRFNPLLGATPDVLILSPQAMDTKNKAVKSRFETISIQPDSWLGTTLRRLVEEVSEKTLGSATIVTRLAELMYVEILRRYMQGLPNKSKGWLAGLRDPEVGRALKYLHAHPEKKWRVAQLASKVGVSRSAFAQRFTDLVGEPPIQYLTGWRMQLEKSLLLQANLSMAMVAKKVGYNSDIAYNRVFKRHIGTPPARWKETVRK